MRTLSLAEVRALPRRASQRGFTLIELLVAVALSTILTGAVVFIFIQAQEIFISVDAKVQVYHTRATPSTASSAT